MLDSPIRQSGWLTNDWQRFNAACIKIRKLLTAESRIREKPEFAGKATQSTTRVGTQGTQGAQAADKSARIAGTIDFQHVDFAFPDDLGTPVLSDIDFHVPAARNSESSAKPAPANRLSSTLSPVSTTQPPVVCSSTASTRATGRSPRCDRKSASSRRIRSCFPIRSAATSALARVTEATDLSTTVSTTASADDVVTTNSTCAAWPPLPARMASSAACRTATIPSSANVASACPADRSSD